MWNNLAFRNLAIFLKCQNKNQSDISKNIGFQNSIKFNRNKKKWKGPTRQKYKRKTWSLDA